MIAIVLLVQVMKKMLSLKTEKQKRFVGCVVIEQKAITLVDCVANPARHFLEEPCRMIHSSHSFAYMAKHVS